MCFFVGNDFLPHLPSLEIRENAIDRLINIYLNNVPKFQGYLTENGIPVMERVEVILTSIGTMEDEIFMKRHEFEEQQRQRERSRSNNYQPPNKRYRPATDPSRYIYFYISKLYLQKTDLMKYGHLLLFISTQKVLKMR
jgi:5'-3' exoribonuclease 2